MPAYDYKNGHRPYKKRFDELTPKVRRIIQALRAEPKVYGYKARIAREEGVSRCFVWQIEKRLEANDE